ncbi:uncharacterized protein LOC127871067 isoform X2 [Dreissena polymorpha]|nr:uncharacterized protein LOC127871067 isoform X2 [Dreissena polymorpha]
MCDFLKCIPEIKHLNLSNTKCNDQVLSVIGHNCPKLHHLAINFTPVTDSGLFSLCQAPMDTAGCKQITHLDIRGTTVRLRGALHCLQNLPDIHYLGFDSICDVIAKDIELRRKNGKEAKIYKFREICDDFLGTKPDSILSVCQWCPYVCKAVFTSGITDENFKAMSALKHLRTLHICSSGSNAVTFTAGVLSLLKDIGHQLEDFMLVDVDFVDLTAIGMYCKNLASLTLWTQDQTESPTNAIDLQGLNLFQIYKKLTSCVICMNPNFGPGKVMTGLSVLLKAALLLQRLSLSYMETLTSDVFMDVLNFNQLSHLEAACFPSCPNLGPDVVVRLLQGSNQLQKLDLTHCEKITRKNYEEFKAFVALNNFKLDISWI